MPRSGVQSVTNPTYGQSVCGWPFDVTFLPDADIYEVSVETTNGRGDPMTATSTMGVGELDRFDWQVIFPFRTSGGVFTAATPGPFA